MATRLVQNKIHVKQSPVHGYGVFAEKNIKMGEIVEECYIIPIDAHDFELRNHLFLLSDGSFGFMTGYGAIYNHSEHPNVECFVENNTAVTFVALRGISKGEEIFFSYSDNLEWFKRRGLEYKEPTVKLGIINPVTLLLFRSLGVLGLIAGIAIALKYFFPLWSKLF